MFTIRFWKDAAERAIRTAAQALIALWGVGVTGILEVDWEQAASVTGLAVVTSLLMSIVSSGMGEKGTASTLSAEPTEEGE